MRCYKSNEKKGLITIKDRRNTLKNGTQMRTNLYGLQSNGGNVNGEEAKGLASNLVLRRPAGGIVAAAEIARKAGFANALVLDMDGTCWNVGLIVDSQVQIVDGTTYLYEVPTVAMNMVGSGGRSIGWHDKESVWRVGPRSGGPACHGKGGTVPTVTDANLFLGRLNPEYYLGGEFPIYPELSREVLERLANDIYLEVEQLAWRIIEMTNESLTSMLRVVSRHRGYDPRDFALIAFGEGGPLHAAALARELGVRTVIIPPTSGALYAHELLLSDIRYVFPEEEKSPLVAVKPQALEQRFLEMEEWNIVSLMNNEIFLDHMLLKRSLDLGYQGQEYSLNLSLEGEITTDLLKKIANQFHFAHKSIYGHATVDEPIEIANLRLSVIGQLKGAEYKGIPHAGEKNNPFIRDVYFNGHGWLDTPVYLRPSLVQDHLVKGPAVIEQRNTTVIVEPGQWVESDEYGNLIVTLEE